MVYLMTLKTMNISQRYVQDTEKSYSYIWGILLDFISSIVNFGNRNIYTYTFFHFKTQTYRYNHRHLWSHITKCFLLYVVAAAAKSVQSCPTLWDPIDCHPWDSPGKNIGVGCHFLLQCMKVKSESEVAQSFPTVSNPWTAAHQAPPSVGFSRQEYWSGLPLPPPFLLYNTIKFNWSLLFFKSISLFKKSIF